MYRRTRKQGSFVLALIVTIATLWYGCKSAEAPVTVVEGDPKAASTDTTMQAGESTSADFMQLTVGEPHPIKSMDPLFASNTSTKRFVQQIYEGLVRYNARGEIEPAIAANWTISNDSLTYRFSLRKNVYYHDSDVFAAGTGQRVVADDFRYVFKRMAHLNVPPTGARLFMAIEGFEPYYREQRQLYDPDDRKLTDISGIQTPNDSTLIFKLRQKDSHFLHKLATPYASVYPKEAVRNTPDDLMITRAVGSGPFQFSQRENDSTFILARFDGYWQNRNSKQMIPRLNRLDIMHCSEQTLYKQFMSGDIDLLPEMGPYTAGQVLTSDGQLTADASEKQVSLYRGGSFSYRLLYNKQSPLNRASVHREINAIDFQRITASIHPHVLTVEYKRSLSLPDPPTKLSAPLQISYSEDPYIRQTIRAMKQAFEQRSVDLRMSALKVPVRETGIIADQQVPLYPQTSDSLDALTLIKFDVQHLALSQSGIEQFEVNRYPWWINLRPVSITMTDKSL